MSTDDTLSRLAHQLGYRLARAKQRFDRRIGKTDQPFVLPYLSFGNEDEALLLGRVLLDPGITPSSPEDGWWRNFLNTYRRADTDELAHVGLRLHALGNTAETVSNAEGYYETRLKVRRVDRCRSWHPVRAEVLPPVEAEEATGKVLVPPVKAEFGVISDLDDTVLRTDVQSLFRMLRATVFENARTRLPFRGVAAFYAALQDGSTGNAGNPIFYVSGSPWNLYDFLEEFLSVQRIPLGPLLLRDWGIRPRSVPSAEHKLGRIEQILAMYPRLRFVLIGDSGERDPEIYRTIIARHPDRILAAYIRNVTPHPERLSSINALIEEVQAVGCTMMLSDDTVTAAGHAVERGWIRPDALERIREEEQMDAPRAQPRRARHSAANTVEVEETGRVRGEKQGATE